MKSIILGGVAALALSVAASAQTNNANNNANSGSDANGQFITKQEPGIVRAPKLVGVSVYDKENKAIGKVSDILLNKDGQVEAVVIGIGGFLGIGQHDVALPYNDVHWETERRTVATNGPAANTTGGAMNQNAANMNQNATTNGNAAGNTGMTATGGASATGATTTANTGTEQKTVSPAEEEAYNGYPDRAMVDMTQAQLKNAPEFKYASQTMNENNSGNATSNSTTKQ